MKKLIIAILILFPAFTFAQVNVQETLQYHNNIRAYFGAPALVLDQDLSRRAQWRAETLVEFNHSGWENSFYGTSYRYIGENLAIDFYDTLNMIVALYYSPTHFKNIINPRFDEIGIGINETLVVMLFGDN